MFPCGALVPRSKGSTIHGGGTGCGQEAQGVGVAMVAMCFFLGGNLKDMYCYNTALVNIDSIHMVYIYIYKI